MPSRSPPLRGRGAQSGDVSHRFNLPQRERDGDWRDAAELVDGKPAKLRTTVTEEHPRTILTFNKSPDIGFDRSINAYRGCEHGCAYCFARPTHAFHDLSPGVDFETKLFAKPDAARLLREALARKGYRPAPIAMGTNTDPYQPIEARYRITRQILEVCLETCHPATITTKSDRVVRDLDILGELAARRLVHVAVSVTSLDPRLSGTLEPRAATPARRMEAILMQAGAAGVRGAGWLMVRLPHEVAPIFREWLDTWFPERAGKVMSIIRSMRGGKDNDPRHFERFRPQGAWAELFRNRFRLARKRAGIPSERVPLDSTQFRPPSTGGQMQLL